MVICLVIIKGKIFKRLVICDNQVLKQIYSCYCVYVFQKPNTLSNKSAYHLVVNHKSQWKPPLNYSNNTNHRKWNKLCHFDIPSKVHHTSWKIPH